MKDYIFIKKTKDGAFPEKQGTSFTSLSVFHLSPRLLKEYDHENKQWVFPEWWLG